MTFVGEKEDNAPHGAELEIEHPQRYAFEAAAVVRRCGDSGEVSGEIGGASADDDDDAEQKECNRPPGIFHGLG